MIQETNQAILPTATRHEYVETFREGAIAANVFKGQSRDGKSYHYFNLSRSYKPDGQDDFSYSSSFFARNAEAMTKVVAEAAKKCKELDA